ncbi:hypothetical protein H9L14_14160 [Sphingomonas sediminicola]|uniref:Uncharacterized protein n=1 Tax=Sphingomonas sediminicola TaxID=386874 RepID=A0ABX6T7L6_9SPHN|nr:hypothetical protein [Sphingomonas sediminicola]QNP45650.1 hypothetical protein H9L14_14160 [Sphingomonas sediminicola]
MTAQVRDRLSYDGRIFPLCSLPLQPWLQETGNAGIFRWPHTANRRGYVASWEIADDRLYLKKLEATLHDGSAASLATLFPGTTGKVFAEWYSGTLRVTDGELLEYIHVGFGSRYERDIFLEIRDGVLVGTSVQENQLPGPRPVIEVAKTRNNRRGLLSRLVGRFCRASLVGDL